jgi:hypothetical protein
VLVVEKLLTSKDYQISILQHYQIKLSWQSQHQKTRKLKIPKQQQMQKIGLK